jgi:hypothetical protein
MRLPLSETERSNLRKKRVRINQIPMKTTEELKSILNCSTTRANELKGLSEFQQIPSIGLGAAKMMVNVLGFYAVNEVRNEDPAELFDRYEKLVGCRVDPCVEDQIRCIVYHANELNSVLEWPDFTDERKAYRDTHGYPSNRPDK